MCDKRLRLTYCANANRKKNNLCLVYLSLTAILRELPVCALSNMSRKELFCQEKRLKLRQQQGGFLERPSWSSVGSLESGKSCKTGTY